MKRYIRSAVRDIHEEDEHIKQDIALSPRTDINTLMQLAEDYDEYVREDVARRPNLPIEVQEKLADDELFCVRRALACNPNISIEIMEKLADEDNWQVPSAVAFNDNAPEYILRKLVNKAPLALAISPVTPIHMLEELTRHEDPDVREEAARMLKIRRGKA